MRGHAAGLAHPPRARGDDEIEFARAQRRDQPRDRRGIVGAVAVHEHDDAGAGGRLRAGEAGPAIAAADGDDFGARAPRLLRRGVRRAAVGNDDPVDDIARQFGDDRRDGFRFVIGRDDDGNLIPPPCGGGGGGREDCLRP